MSQFVERLDEAAARYKQGGEWQLVSDDERPEVMQLIAEADKQTGIHTNRLDFFPVKHQPGREALHVHSFSQPMSAKAGCASYYLP